MNVTFGCCRLQPSSERVQRSACGLTCILDSAVLSLTSCLVFTHGAAGGHVTRSRMSCSSWPPPNAITQRSACSAGRFHWCKVWHTEIWCSHRWALKQTTHTAVCVWVCKVDSAVDGKWWLRSFALQNWLPCQRNAATVCLFWCILSVKCAHAAHMEKLCNARRATPVSYERESHFKKACSARRIIRCKIPENRQMSNWKCGMLSKAASAKWAFTVRIFRLYGKAARRASALCESGSSR